MTDRFTQYSDESIWSIEDDDFNYEHALDYLNDPSHFRTFSQGLTELIQRYGYNEALDDTQKKTDFLFSRLSNIDISISKSTVKSWFADTRRPYFSSGSRNTMFYVCFALSCSLDDIEWFFHHVYFDRSFNCHSIKEAVYFYCFKNCLPYSHAKKLLHDIDSLASSEPDDKVKNIFTKEIRERISQISSDEELMLFFKKNKNIFTQWNKSAQENIKELLKQIRGKDEDRKTLRNFKNQRYVSKNEISECGLVIQEYLVSQKDGRRDDISGKNCSSIDFMLERIIGWSHGLGKNIDLPMIVKHNFPSKKTFSDFLKSPESYTSYEAIRKSLILLKFYQYHVVSLINELQPCEPQLDEPQPDDRFDIFLDEINHLLFSCGYDMLYSGNPYDWLFLWAATTEYPLESFRNAMGALEI